MARGITEEDVHRAADAIVSRGERPTIERIRAELGRGSPNTVNRHLDTWWSFLSKRLAPQIDDLPPEIAELARRIWQQVLPKATELAESRLGEAASEISARTDRLIQEEAILREQRRQFAETRVQLERRIGELEAVLAARDETIKNEKRSNERIRGELKAAQTDAAAARTSLARAQSAHAAEASKLSERLSGTEKRLMERLAQEKTVRDVEGATARKRIKSLEDDLRSTRKLLDDRSAAALQFQAGLRSELDTLRKLLSRPARARPGSRSAVSESSRRSAKPRN